MKFALAAVGFINEDIEHNKKVIINCMEQYAGYADVVIFGEAFLQGFYGATFSESHDVSIAIEKDSETIREISTIAREHSIAVSFGFIEKEDDLFFSSQITIDKNGHVIDLYRRVSPGWKEAFASAKYCEGRHFHTFLFEEKKVVIGLCGDLWFDDNIKEIRDLAPDIVWWPVYTDYKYNEWNSTIKHEYAQQAEKLGKPVFYVNSLCIDKANEEVIAKGGACLFSNGRIACEIESGEAGILVVEQ